MDPRTLPIATVDNTNNPIKHDKLTNDELEHKEVAPGDEDLAVRPVVESAFAGYSRRAITRLFWKSILCACCALFGALAEGYEFS
jgi:hypothetical protein